MQADTGARIKPLVGEAESPRSIPQSYRTHFGCKIDPEKEMKFNPWTIEKSFT